MSPTKDAYDFAEEQKPAEAPKPEPGSLLLRLGTLYFWISALALIAYFVFIYFNPHHSLNPFPPAAESEPVSLAASDTPEPQPTATATLEVLPEAATPTPTEASAAQETTPTPTTAAYPTPTDVVLMTGTPSGTQEARRFYIPQEGTPSYLSYPGGCGGIYVAGNVIDLEDDPVMLLTVRASGMLGDQPVNLEVLSGSNPAYTESGWEIQLSDQLVSSTGTITIALYEQGVRTPVSEEVVIDTVSDCSKNLVVVNFVQERTE